jgi:two-component system, chemotaxis family, CheB/CheR fusion protein
MEPDTKAETDNPTKSFPVVGIGASAGGFHALERFLSVLPEEFGFAIVFLQHLSSSHESHLLELIRAHKPDLDSEEASDGREMLPGKLYLCPPASNLSMEQGMFRVTRRSDVRERLPIDEFLSSLARDASQRAIAVIFSGAGTDGAIGLEAVRAAGGAVFVQDPATAEFPDMPLAAIDTGQMDGVLPPEDIAREILKFYRSGMVAISPDTFVGPQQFEPFFRVILDKTGYRFNHYKKSVVSRRIRRRMYLHGVSSINDYLTMVEKGDQEATMLAADLMIGVTSFFRDRLAWKALHLDVTRKLAAEDDDTPIRIWTPACATGEEAYSIAMMIHHELDLSGRKREIQVFATDVNDRALEKARSGIYPSSIAGDMSPEYIRKFFTYSEDGLTVTINKEIRQHVVFAKQDLLVDPPFSRLDIVICRNLLIYLEPEAQEKCISLFHYALKKGGCLFLGNAESPGRNNTAFVALAHKKCRVYRKVEAERPERMPLALPFAADRQVSPPSRQGVVPEPRQSAMQSIQEALLEEYAPAAVAINQNHEIIYHNGPTNRYLRQPRGNPTQNLLDLLPEKLRSRIRGGLYRTTQEPRPVSIRTTIQDGDQLKKQISIRITKLRENLFLIVFRDMGSPSQEPETVALDEAIVEETAVRQLENELSATRDELQSHIEQLKSLNEELQSSNEELQAANEELETSREELQSLNEELITVNAQFQTKIEEQEETNNDLNNFLASTSIPTIFLDHRFQVKRFTAAMSRLIKLLPGDVGRPIIDMSQEHLGPDLIIDARSVLDSLTPIRRELGISGAWYVRSTLPYRTSDNRIEGVVVTYTDVTELKLAEEALRAARDDLEVAVQERTKELKMANEVLEIQIAERGRAEEALKTANETLEERVAERTERIRHLASFPQVNPNPVMEMALSGEITFCNPAAEEYLEHMGFDRSDCRTLLPADLDGILKDWDGGKQSTLYREVTVKDRVFDETIQFLPQFKVARVYTREITDRKRAEERIIRAKEEWERTFDSVPDMIAILDNDHRVMRVNQAMARRLGLKPEECVGLPCYKAVHGASVPPDFCPHVRTLRDGGEHIEEVHEDRLGGDFMVSTTPFYDARGKMVGSVHVARDITERKRMERELAKTHQRLQALMNALPVGVSFSDDSSCERVTGNPAVLAQFEVGPEENLSASAPDDKAFGRQVRFFREGREISAGELPLQMAVAENREIPPMELEVFLPGGRLWFAEGSAAPIHDGRGRVIGGVAVTLDITDRKKADEALKKSVERLNIISDTASRLLLSEAPQEVVEALCRRVMEHLDCHVFFNFLVDEDLNCLRLNAYAGIPEETARDIHLLEYGVAVCGCAARDACRIVAENIPDTPDVRTDLVRSFGIKAYACHPLFVQGHVIGTLSFGTRSRLTFGDDELALMKSVADQVATAMERVRLLRSAEGRAEELELRVRERTSELNRSHDELRMANVYNRSLIEASIDPFVTISPDGKVRDINTATERVTGYSREQVVGSDFSDYFTDPKRAQAGYVRIFDEGVVRDYELEIRHKDGHTTPVVYNAAVYRDEDGKVMGAFAAARDVTEQRQLEEQLRQAHKMEAIGTLAGGIAHDFNNILASILGFTEMAIEDVLDRPRVKLNLERVLKSGIRARNLVSQILAFSRKTGYTRSPLALTPIIKETVQFLRASLPSTIQISLTISATSDIVLAAPVEAQQILMNLSTNAAFAMREKGGHLDITLENADFGTEGTLPGPGMFSGHYVELVVKDTGIGMTPEVMKRVFEPFFTTKGVGEGTGMGLAVVYGTVKDLHGTVTIESESGAGSTFRVFIPKVGTDEKPKNGDASTSPVGSERVLFVDDEDLIMEWGKATLERLGYEVIATTDNREALAIFAANADGFDLVVTDQTMPGMTGVQFARELMAIRGDIPIILCTGHSETVTAEEAMGMGVREFLMKPLTRRELADAIRRVLDGRTEKTRES